MNTRIHIGNALTKAMEDRGLSDVWVSKGVNRHRNTVANAKQNSSMNTDLLYAFCVRIGVDLFKLFSDALEQEYGSTISSPDESYGQFPEKQRYLVEIVDGRPTIKKLDIAEEGE